MINQLVDTMFNRWIDVFVDLREDTGSPACYRCEDSRAEVSGRVDSVARVKAHRQSNDQDHKANSKSLQSLRDRVVVRIHDSQDADYERGCSDDLWKTREELNVSAQVGRWLHSDWEENTWSKKPLTMVRCFPG